MWVMGRKDNRKVKLLRQFLVIMAVSFVGGNPARRAATASDSASIYGLVLMLALLMTGAFKT